MGTDSTARREPAYLLVMRNFIPRDFIPREMDGEETEMEAAASQTLTTRDLWNEIQPLPWDTQVKLHGTVKNKRARYNLCFADYSLEPDYEAHQARVYDMTRLPHMCALRGRMAAAISSVVATGPSLGGSGQTPIEAMECEGNYYYDLDHTYIGFHGDTERKRVVGVRLGATIPLWFQWYSASRPVGPAMMVDLHDGDLFVMSDKAVGHDWRRPSIHTLRHAAGHASVLRKTTDKSPLWVSPICQLKPEI